MRLLYLTGTRADVDAVATEQLSRIAPQLSVTTVGTAAEALVEIRRPGGFHALLTSPSLGKNETLAIITSLRTDRVPIAIVPVVGDAHQDFFASAIGAGADDVLVLRGETLVQPTETLTRIRQSPHLFPTDDRRLRVLYAGTDPVVWDLLAQLPFVKAEQGACSVDGTCIVRQPGAADGSLRCDVVVIDEKPNDAHPLQVVKSVKAQASDLSVVVLSPQGPADISTAAFDLGADDAVLKTSAYRRRMVATLRRVHQRLELSTQHTTLREREARLRQIVETMPEGLSIISGDGTVLAMNAAGLTLMGATRPREIVGRDFSTMVAPDDRGEVRRKLEDITAGHAGDIQFDLEGVDRMRRRVELRGVRLERDARGGRGVIATLREAGATPASAADSVSAVDFERERALESALSQAEARLRELDVELRAAERRGGETESAAAVDRGRWEVERSALEMRVREAEHAAASVAHLESALEAARGELHRTEREHVEQRGAWDAARHALEGQLHEQTEAANRARADLEAALQSARADHDTAGREREARLAETQERERAGWDTERQTLEHRLQEMRVAWDTARHEAEARRAEHASSDAARTDLTAGLDAARAEIEALHDAQARARAEWENARVERAALEAARADADAAARDAASLREERTDLDATLSAAQGLLRQTTAEHKADRLRWDSQRLELETRLQNLSEMAHGRDALEAKLESLYAELRDAGQAREADLARMESERQTWGAEYARWTGERDAWSTERQRGETERERWDAERLAWQAERSRWDHERTAWDGQRCDLEARLDHVSQAANGRGALEATVEGLREELRQAAASREQAMAQWNTERGQWETERARSASARAEFDRQEAAHATERAAWDQKRRELESRLTDIEALNATRANLETALDGLRAELRAAADAVAAERASWDQARQHLEHARREADEARQAERRRAETAERAHDERRDHNEALEGERRQLQAERSRLEGTIQALEAAQTEIANARAAAFTERDQLRHELDRVRDELDVVRRKLEQEQTRRTLLEAAVREARRDAEGRLAAVEAEFVSVRGGLQRELADVNARLKETADESRKTTAELEDRLTATALGHERLLTNTLFGHATMTQDGLLVRCNDAFAQLFGYLNAREAQSRTAGRPFPALAGRTWLDEKLQSEGRIDRVESNLERIDRSTIRVLESAELVVDSAGQTVVERTLVDRTGSLAHAERVRQADRLEEVGTLVAAMAPDIESLLGSVVASGSELADALPAADTRREHTTRILSHAAQASDLIHQLAAFSLKQVRPADPVDLAEAVRRAERLLRPLLGPHVALKTRLNRTESVPVSQDDFDRLLSALVVAGRDLLPIGGTLTIETARVELNEIDADPATGLRPGAHLRLAVTASGYGVQAAQRTAALDAVATRCGGHLRVVEEAGRSSSLRVYFTRWAGTAGPVA